MTESGIWTKRAFEHTAVVGRLRLSGGPTFGGIESENGFSVQQTSDGGYIIAGSMMPYGAGDFDVWLVKVGLG